MPSAGGVVGARPHFRAVDDEVDRTGFLSGVADPYRGRLVDRQRPFGEVAAFAAIATDDRVERRSPSGRVEDSVRGRRPGRNDACAARIPMGRESRGREAAGAATQRRGACRRFRRGRRFGFPARSFSHRSRVSRSSFEERSWLCQRDEVEVGETSRRSEDTAKA
jgi:hypothetical protein